MRSIVLYTSGGMPLRVPNQRVRLHGDDMLALVDDPNDKPHGRLLVVVDADGKPRGLLADEHAATLFSRPVDGWRQSLLVAFEDGRDYARDVIELGTVGEGALDDSALGALSVDRFGCDDKACAFVEGACFERTIRVGLHRVPPGACAMDNELDLPDGWVEIQRDDDEAVFADDEDAAKACSPDAKRYATADGIVWIVPEAAVSFDR